jgi:hypothetical protein
MTESKGIKSYTFSWVSLDKHVLIVKVTSGEVNHGAFIGAVKGENYDAEVLDVATNGSSAWPQLAGIYFKGFGSGPVKPFREYNPFFEPSGINYTLLGPQILQIRLIDKNVLLVAVRADGNSWKAFIGAVKGEDYAAEAPEVIKTGTPTSYELAEVCFEDLAKGEKWHEPLRVFIADEDYGPAEEWGDEKPARPRA